MFADVGLFSCSGNKGHVCTPEEYLERFYKESKFTYVSLICCEIFVGKDFLYDDLRIPA